MPVYPRACGGTYQRDGGSTPCPGLSPRVRGNHTEVENVLVGKRSIPARAGEPLLSWHGDEKGTVYPRACGGTSIRPRCRRLSSGLSPRVRGNPRRLIRMPRRIRSIPARAGEPKAADQDAKADTVYPRACGGTFDQIGLRCQIPGLSPRVRGNLAAMQCLRVQLRSIPARAGEPV